MLIIGHPPIEVRLKRNPRAKRLTLRLSRLDGKATLTIPTRISDAKAHDFLAEQEQWLRTQLAKSVNRQSVEIGGTVPFLGQPHMLQAATTKLIRAQDGHITINPTQTGPRLRAFMKTEARNALAPLIHKYAAQISRPINRLTLRDTRSRWGSCSVEGNLMFSWRLVMAPPEVLDYVAAHEVAHLAEMNHSSDFWAVVQLLMPDYKTHRHWLREHGAGLHAIDFS